MKFNHRLRERPLACPWEVCDEDADLPSQFVTKTRNHKDNRKAKQLCRQVAETLDLVLSGDCDDELLQSLHVISVVPAPHSSRLLVTVSADLTAEQYDRQQILSRLEEQAGRLRAEVAASIHRKRVPVLVFDVVGPAWSVS
jgi:ribosome-binding factor A